jgi:hypothetical protein
LLRYTSSRCDPASFTYALIERRHRRRTLFLPPQTVE